MKLFISWSGDRSQNVAQALQSWLPLVLHYVDPWLSDAHIGAGERWGQTVAKELEACNFGILCITRENVGSPWVLFEAGSLAKSLEGSRVIPLLFDVEFSEIGGPLAQFQAKKTDREGLSEIISSLNKIAPSPVPESRATQLFDALWPEFEKHLGAVPKHPASAKPIRPQPEVLEELVAGVRTLETRFKGLEENVMNVAMDPARNARMRRGRRIHPMLMMEYTHSLGNPSDPAALLLVASFFREELPWVYDLSVEAYYTLRKNHPAESVLAIKRLKEIMELFLHTPLGEEYPPSTRESISALTEMLHYILVGPDHILNADRDELLTKRRAAFQRPRDQKDAPKGKAEE